MVKFFFENNMHKTFRLTQVECGIAKKKYFRMRLTILSSKEIMERSEVIATGEIALKHVNLCLIDN